MREKPKPSAQPNRRVVISERPVLIVVISLGPDQLKEQTRPDGAAEEARRGDQAPSLQTAGPHNPCPEVQPPAIRDRSRPAARGGQHREVDPRLLPKKRWNSGPDRPLGGVRREHLWAQDSSCSRCPRTCRGVCFGAISSGLRAVCVF